MRYARLAPRVAPGRSTPRECLAPTPAPFATAPDRVPMHRDPIRGALPLSFLPTILATCTIPQVVHPLRASCV